MKLSRHTKEQAARYARLFAYLFVPAMFNLYNSHMLTRTAIVGAAVASLEVIWRQVVPASGKTDAPAVDESVASDETSS